MQFYLLISTSLARFRGVVATTSDVHAVDVIETTITRKSVQIYQQQMSHLTRVTGVETVRRSGVE